MVAEPDATAIVAVSLFPPAVAVTVWLGTVASTKPLNALVPAISAPAAGSVADVSDEVKPTDAVDPVATFSYASYAVTVRPNAWPASTVAGAPEIPIRESPAGVTEVDRDAVRVEPASTVTVRVPTFLKVTWKIFTPMSAAAKVIEPL